jgi:O-antigen/teichoic acid export membrane protein
MSHKLLRNIFIFVIGTVFNKGMNFFILPVLTYYLTKEDYGMLGLISSVMTITIIYIGFFPSNFIMVKFSKLGKEEMAKYISNILLLTIVSFLFVLLILTLFRGYIFSAYSDNFYLVLYIGFLSLFQVLWQQVSTLIQIEKDAVKFVLYQFIQTSVTIGLALLLVIKFSMGWKGKFYAEFTIFLFSALYALYYMRKEGYITYDFDFKKIKELFAFLFPLSFYVVGLYIMGTVDKLFLANMISLEAAGIYAIAITMTIVMNIVFDAVLRAWEPYMFELLNDNSHSANLQVVKVIYLFYLFITLFMVLYILFVPYLFGWMIDEKFNEALLYIPILVVAYSFEGLRKPITEILSHLNRVKTVGTITIVAAILNIGLNFYLIPIYGTYGAAYATLIAFAFLFFATLFYVLRHADLPWLLK